MKSKNKAMYLLPNSSCCPAEAHSTVFTYAVTLAYKLFLSGIFRHQTSTETPWLASLLFLPSLSFSTYHHPRYKGGGR